MLYASCDWAATIRLFVVPINQPSRGSTQKTVCVDCLISGLFADEFGRSFSAAKKTRFSNAAQKIVPGRVCVYRKNAVAQAQLLTHTIARSTNENRYRPGVPRTSGGWIQWHMNRSRNRR